MTYYNNPFCTNQLLHSPTLSHSIFRLNHFCNNQLFHLLSFSQPVRTLNHSIPINNDIYPVYNNKKIALTQSTSINYYINTLFPTQLIHQPTLTQSIITLTNSGTANCYINSLYHSKLLHFTHSIATNYINLSVQE